MSFCSDDLMEGVNGSFILVKCTVPFLFFFFCVSCQRNVTKLMATLLARQGSIKEILNCMFNVLNTPSFI